MINTPKKVVSVFTKNINIKSKSFKTSQKIITFVGYSSYELIFFIPTPTFGKKNKQKQQKHTKKIYLAKTLQALKTDLILRIEIKFYSMSGSGTTKTE